MKLIITTLAVACLTVACNQATQNKNTAASDVYTIPQTADVPVIESYLPELKSAMVQQFTFVAGKAASVVTKEGTEITIPENCFVYEDGSPVKDKVNVAFSQYDNPVEIIISGIPMTMKVNGEDKAFESAGMFDIKGQCNGKTVSVAKDKNISIKLKTAYKDTDYNFYRYNETENKWETLETADKLAARTTVEKAKNTAAFDPDKPVAFESHKPNTPVFELDVNAKTLNGMENFDNILWTYAGAGNDPFKSSDFFKTKWSSTTIVRSSKKENAYDVTCESRDKKFETCVKPVLFGSQLKRAQQAYQKLMDEYNARVAARQNMEKEIEIQSKAVRMLSVSSFGVYNCDRYSNVVTTRIAGFRAHIKDNKNFASTRYYMVTPSVNAAVYLGEGKNFIYNPKEDNYILALMENNKVAISTPDQVNTMDPGETNDLTFRVSEKTLDEKADFQSLLAFN